MVAGPGDIDFVASVIEILEEAGVVGPRLLAIDEIDLGVVCQHLRPHSEVLVGVQTGRFAHGFDLGTHPISKLSDVVVPLPHTSLHHTLERWRARHGVATILVSLKTGLGRLHWVDTAVCSITACSPIARFSCWVYVVHEFVEGATSTRSRPSTLHVVVWD